MTTLYGGTTFAAGDAGLNPAGTYGAGLNTVQLTAPNQSGIAPSVGDLSGGVAFGGGTPFGGQYSFANSAPTLPTGGVIVSTFPSAPASNPISVATVPSSSPTVNAPTTITGGIGNVQDSGNTSITSTNLGNALASLLTGGSISPGPYPGIPSLSAVQPATLSNPTAAGLSGGGGSAPNIMPTANLSSMGGSPPFLPFAGQQGASNQAAPWNVSGGAPPISSPGMPPSGMGMPPGMNRMLQGGVAQNAMLGAQPSPAQRILSSPGMGGATAMNPGQPGPPGGSPLYTTQRAVDDSAPQPSFGDLGRSFVANRPPMGSPPSRLMPPPAPVAPTGDQLRQMYPALAPLGKPNASQSPDELTNEFRDRMQQDRQQIYADHADDIADARADKQQAQMMRAQIEMAINSLPNDAQLWAGATNETMQEARNQQAYAAQRVAEQNHDTPWYLKGGPLSAAMFGQSLATPNRRYQAYAGAFNAQARRDALYQQEQAARDKRYGELLKLYSDAQTAERDANNRLRDAEKSRDSELRAAYKDNERSYSDQVNYQKNLDANQQAQIRNENYAARTAAESADRQTHEADRHEEAGASQGEKTRHDKATEATGKQNADTNKEKADNAAKKEQDLQKAREAKQKSVDAANNAKSVAELTSARTKIAKQGGDVRPYDYRIAQMNGVLPQQFSFDTMSQVYDRLKSGAVTPEAVRARGINPEILSRVMGGRRG